MSEKIMTLHPDPEKKGVNIERAKYEQVRAAIVYILNTRGSLKFYELIDTLENELAGKFEGSVAWYGTTVKLDLEGRGILKRVGKAPQKLVLVEGDSHAD